MSEKKNKVKEKGAEKPEKLEHSIVENVLLYPLVSEKAVDKIEKENKITFIVRKDVTKQDIKKVFEEEFKAKVDKVNVLNDMKGRKKAIITVNKQYKASDIAMKLGIL
jgi:ribosomal protein uL23